MESLYRKINDLKVNLWNYNYKKGFTLVELLIIITIIGILTTVGVGAYTNSLKKARDSKAVSDIKEITKALEIHHTIESSYPADLSSLTNYKGETASYVYTQIDSGDGFCLCSYELESDIGGNKATQSCSGVSGNNYFCLSNSQ